MNIINFFQPEFKSKSCLELVTEKDSSIHYNHKRKVLKRIVLYSTQKKTKNKILWVFKKDFPSLSSLNLRIIHHNSGLRAGGTDYTAS